MTFVAKISSQLCREKVLSFRDSVLQTEPVHKRPKRDLIWLKNKLIAFRDPQAAAASTSRRAQWSQGLVSWLKVSRQARRNWQNLPMRHHHVPWR
ncbi:hypothetical protein F2Q68_00015469 [Brassica cretica]|uniref:Uncharacterized protein n=2 Tax=Brassica cretica TaxID=69181 RepID=A0A8S9HQM2_BRACR|nr:hypothetical protein F2Q68_00015469 [Brassica cretica]KAF3608096.1 hypothetical protein DY000_02048100 [Brassica cretica]